MVACRPSCSPRRSRESSKGSVRPVAQDQGVRFWILTHLTESVYFVSEHDAKEEIARLCSGLCGEWVERDLGDGVTEWAFYELDERGELLEVLVWELQAEELILA